MASTQPGALKEIHLVFKTHLDVGFTALARNVVHQYLEQFIPAAIDTAAELRREGREERFIWTTGSWIIWEYLERARGRRLKQMEEAIAAGDIVWHALPHTTWTEMMDPAMFRFGLSLGQELDRRFGRKTIAAKMTDVPGHTRSMVPLLAEAGVQFLHIGVNEATSAPDVPQVFRWRHPEGAEVVVMYHIGGYGAMEAIPGMEEALSFAHTLDNRGPQTPYVALQQFEDHRRKYPGAKVFGSTLDDYARKLLRHREELPVVSEEIGDTWIHGIGTDPWKVSRFRELQRLRTRWLEEGKADPEEKRFRDFSLNLSLTVEHTWGLDEKVYLADQVHFDPPMLKELRKQNKTKLFEASWDEQREYIENAFKALGRGPLGQEARAACEALEVRRPSSQGMKKHTQGVQLDTKHFEIGFDAVSGAIDLLTEKDGGRRWAGPNNPLGLFNFEIFCREDYDRYLSQYMINWEDVKDWAIEDFGKPGLETSVSRHQVWTPARATLWQTRREASDYVLAELRMPEDVVHCLGCPPKLTIEYELPDAEPVVAVRLQWYRKRASRLPEAMWLSFRPMNTRDEGWMMDKLGGAVSPLEVVKKGNRRLHGVLRGVNYEDARGALAIETLDAPLVAPGEPGLLDFSNRQPQPRRGMHFNLWNNIWGTNFRMWYDEDAAFRFKLKFGGGR